jgi:serine/threonine protein kinase
MKRGRGMEDDEYPTVVLGDFGCAVTSAEVKNGKFATTRQPFGTEAWFPPEGLDGYAGEYAKCYGKSTDIWQLGAVIACMARLDVLPDRAALATTKPCGPAYSDALNKIVHEMLNGKIGKRPTAIDVAEKMQAWGYLKKIRSKP